MQKAIQARVDAGARFYFVKSKPSLACGSTLIGCTRCGASLNLHHAYFGKDGLYDPDVVRGLDLITTNFWFDLAEQGRLDMLLGTPAAARMCTAEIFRTGCRMEEVCDV